MRIPSRYARISRPPFWALALLAGLLLGIGATAYAANKTPNLSPPTDHTRVNSICLNYDARANFVTVTIDAFAFDPVTQIRDQATVGFRVSPANASIQNLYTAAIAQWVAKKGY